MKRFIAANAAIARQRTWWNQSARTIDCTTFVGIALDVMRSVSIKSPAGAAHIAPGDTNRCQNQPRWRTTDHVTAKVPEGLVVVHLGEVARASPPVNPRA